MAPKMNVLGLGLWAFAAKNPALYRFGTRVIARLLKLIGRDGAVHSFPLMRGWFAVRDFPVPEGRTFQEQLRR
jgi:L-lactate dehydrogenase complex protein LldF